MKRFLTIIMFALLFSSCGEEGPREIPEGVLSYDEMVNVLLDIQFEIALHQKRYVQRNKLEDLVVERYDQVYEKNFITKEQFEKSFEFYKEDPEDLKEIYETVLEQLSLRMGELRAKRGRDSKQSVEEE